jgi:chromosome partitioning protein
MKIISILNQKGGVGKTTLATNIATKLYRDGEKVLLVDTDKQGSARDWHAASNNEMAVVGIDRPTLDKDIQKIADNFDWIIIDGSPSLQDMAISAIKCSDLIIIPVTPSPYDVWATSELVELIKYRQQLTEGKPKAYFCISRRIVKTVISNETLEALKEFDLPRLENATTHLVAYVNSVKQGQTVFDTRDAKAKQEITDIVNEIREIMK